MKRAKTGVPLLKPNFIIIVLDSKVTSLAHTTLGLGALFPRHPALSFVLTLL